jgi:hypothetical protein
MSRRKSRDLVDVTVGDLWDEYQRSANLEEVASRYGFTDRTLRTYFRSAGLGPLPPGPKVADTSEVPLHHKGCLGAWLREHPGTTLPSSLKAIQELTGCSYASVNSYLSRKRKMIRERMSRLPSLRLLEIPLPSLDGRLINTRYFLAVSKKVSKDFKVIIQANLTPDHIERFKLTIEELETLIEEHRGDSHILQTTMMGS